jgi:hypothetical protein
LFVCFALVKQTFVLLLGNNAYIFPGLGLGIVATQARHVTDDMFYIAATHLASCVQQEQIDEGMTTKTLVLVCLCLSVCLFVDVVFLLS